MNSSSFPFKKESTDVVTGWVDLFLPGFPPSLGALKGRWQHPGGGAAEEAGAGPP